MDDAEAIRALIHEYAARLDAGDLDGVAELFEHATWRSAGRPEVLHGADQARRAYSGVILYDDGRPGTMHLITNVTVVSNGAELASARSYFTVLQACAGVPLQAVVAGEYHDEFARVDGEWRFTDRLIVPRLVGDLTHHLAAGSGAPPRT